MKSCVFVFGIAFVLLMSVSFVSAGLFCDIFGGSFCDSSDRELRGELFQLGGGEYVGPLHAYYFSELDNADQRALIDEISGANMEVLVGDFELSVDQGIDLTLDDRLRIANSQMSGLNDVEISIALWLKMNGESYVFKKKSSASQGDGQKGFSLRGTRNTLKWFAGGLGSDHFELECDGNFGEWNRIVLTGETNGKKMFYVNGEKCGEAPAGTRGMMSPNNFFLSTNRGFGGSVDDLEIYNRVLDEDEILQDYERYIDNTCREADRNNNNIIGRSDLDAFGNCFGKVVSETENSDCLWADFDEDRSISFGDNVVFGECYAKRLEAEVCEPQTVEIRVETIEVVNGLEIDVRFVADDPIASLIINQEVVVLDVDNPSREVEVDGVGHTVTLIAATNDVVTLQVSCPKAECSVNTLPGEDICLGSAPDNFIRFDDVHSGGSFSCGTGVAVVGIRGPNNDAEQYRQVTFASETPSAKEGDELAVNWVGWASGFTENTQMRALISKDDVTYEECDVTQGREYLSNNNEDSVSCLLPWDTDVVYIRLQTIEEPNALIYMRSFESSVCEGDDTTYKNRCSEMSNELKRDIFELQNDDDNVILTEGEVIHHRDYVVVGDEDVGIRLLRLVDVRKGSASYRNNRVEFRDYYNGGEYEAVFTSDSEGSITIEGEYYDVTLTGDYAQPKDQYEVTLTWDPENEINDYVCDELILFYDYVYFNPSLQEVNEDMNVREYIDYLESQSDLVPESRVVSISKKNDNGDFVSYGEVTVNKNEWEPNCYENYNGIRLCSVGYDGSYTPTEEGLYSVENSDRAIKFLIVDEGYYNRNLVLEESSLYDFYYDGDYDSYRDVVRVYAQYYDNDDRDERYHAEITKFNSVEEAQVFIDQILEEVDRALLSSTEEINGNILYIFGEPSAENLYLVWKSGSDAVVMTNGDYRDNEEDDIDIQEFINALAGNSDSEFVSLEYRDLSVLYRVLAESYLNLYPSDLDVQSCQAFWECETLPVLCPEYGRQKETCVDRSSCGRADVVRENSCQPGVCSGCYLPEQYYKGGEIARCVPFGFRLQTSLNPEDNYELENAFCDVDGRLYGQKELEESCHNNFECASNQCSNNECVGLVEEVRAQRSLLVSIWCRVTNLLDDEGYEQCLRELN